MRKRVTFSYIDNYTDIHNSYVNTIFFEYPEKNIYKNTFKYTYFHDCNVSYLNYDRGVIWSYINDAHILSINDKNYEKYKYTFNDSDTLRRSDKPWMSKVYYRYYPYYKTYPYKLSRTELNNSYMGDFYHTDEEKQSKYIHIIGEEFGTKIYVDDAKYTYFPSFIEGFEQVDYYAYVTYYGVSTNNMAYHIPNKYNYPISGFYNNSNNEHDIISNIRGRVPVMLDGDEPELKRIGGIGFKKGAYPDELYQNTPYNEMLTVYVYDEDGRHIHNAEVYNALSITLPGIPNDSYSVVKNDDNCILNIHGINHLGIITVIIELNYKNNNYSLCEQLNFHNALDIIYKFKPTLFKVNNIDLLKRSFLYGDYIEQAYVYTMPERANGEVKLHIDRSYFTNGIENIIPGTTYDGTTNKYDHSRDIRKYVINQPVSYSKNQNAPILPIKKNFDFTLTYNIVDYGHGNTSFDSDTKTTDVHKLLVDNVKFSYEYNGVKYDTIPSNVFNFDENCTYCYVTCYFDISPNYQEKLILSNLHGMTYNQVIYSYEGSEENRYMYATHFNEIEHKQNFVTKNTYMFHGEVTGPGKYDFTYTLINGQYKVTNEILGTYIFKLNNVINADNILLTTYEGANADLNVIKLLDNENYISNDYILDDECLVEYNTFKIPKCTFNNWSEPYSYIDVHHSEYSLDNENYGTNYKNEVIGNIGLLRNVNSMSVSKKISDTSLDDHISLDYNNIYNKYRTITTGLNVSVSKIQSSASLKYNNNTINLWSMQNYPSSNTIGKINNVGEDNGIFDISRINSDVVNFTIEESLNVRALPGMGTSQEILNNFKLDSKNFKYKFTNNFGNITQHDIASKFNRTLTDWIYYETIYDTVNNKLEIKFTVEKSKILNIHFPITIEYDTKLNRNSSSEYSTEYWDNLGFADAIHSLSIDLQNSKQKIEDLSNIANNILLFTNVIDYKTNNNYCREIVVEKNNLFMEFEKVSIAVIDYNISEDNWIWNENDIVYINYENGTYYATYENNNTTVISIKQHVVTIDDVDYIVYDFKPEQFGLDFELLNNIGALKIRIRTSEGLTKDINIFAEEVKLNIKDLSSHYLRDLFNPDKIAYEEIKLGRKISTVDDVTIYDHEINANNNNDNDYYLFYDNNVKRVNLTTNNYLLNTFGIDDYIEYKFFGKSVTYDENTTVVTENSSIILKDAYNHSNIPNGILLNMELINIDYNYDNQVLIPKSTEGVIFKLNHNYYNNNINNLVITSIINMLEIEHPKNKIYTNGAGTIETESNFENFKNSFSIIADNIYQNARAWNGHWYGSYKEILTDDNYENAAELLIEELHPKITQTIDDEILIDSVSIADLRRIYPAYNFAIYVNCVYTEHKFVEGQEVNSTNGYNGYYDYIDLHSPSGSNSPKEYSLIEISLRANGVDLCNTIVGIGKFEYYRRPENNEPQRYFAIVNNQFRIMLNNFLNNGYEMSTQPGDSATLGSVPFCPENSSATDNTPDTMEIKFISQENFSRFVSEGDGFNYSAINNSNDNNFGFKYEIITNENEENEEKTLYDYTDLRKLMYPKTNSGQNLSNYIYYRGAYFSFASDHLIEIPKCDKGLILLNPNILNEYWDSMTFNKYNIKWITSEPYPTPINSLVFCKKPNTTNPTPGEYYLDGGTLHIELNSPTDAIKYKQLIKSKFNAASTSMRYIMTVGTGNQIWSNPESVGAHVGTNNYFISTFNQTITTTTTYTPTWTLKYSVLCHYGYSMNETEQYLESMGWPTVVATAMRMYNFNLSTLYDHYVNMQNPNYASSEQGLWMEQFLEDYGISFGIDSITNIQLLINENDPTTSVENNHTFDSGALQQTIFQLIANEMMTGRTNLQIECAGFVVPQYKKITIYECKYVLITYYIKGRKHTRKMMVDDAYEDFELEITPETGAVQIYTDLIYEPIRTHLYRTRW